MSENEFFSQGQGIWRKSDIRAVVHVHGSDTKLNIYFTDGTHMGWVSDSADECNQAFKDFQRELGADKMLVLESAGEKVEDSNVLRSDLEKLQERFDVLQSKYDAVFHAYSNYASNYRWSR